MVENSSEQFKEPSGETNDVQETIRLVDLVGHHVSHFLLENRMMDETDGDGYTGLDQLQKGLESAISLNNRVERADLKEIIDAFQSIDADSKRDDELLNKIDSLLDNLHNIKE
jgi:hypothetical protein